MQLFNRATSCMCRVVPSGIVNFPPIDKAFDTFPPDVYT